MAYGLRRTKRSNSSPSARFYFIALMGTIVVFAIISFLSTTSRYVNWMVAITITTFLLYGYDKLQAKRGGPRVPELVLHEMALLGGFVGGGLGMLFFRHKIRKPAFWLVLAVSMLLHAAVIHFYPRMLG